MARKASAEGHRLITELFTLSTVTIVVDSPSEVATPSMQKMLEDLHETYRELASQPPTAPFSTISAVARERHAEQPVEEQLLGRVAGFGENLHRIVEEAGDSQPDDPESEPVKIDERKLTPRDAGVIRAAWELAGDPVHLTTKIWLDDGDLVNDFACRARSDLAPEVVAFHGAMARLTIETWEELIRLVSQFLATMLGTLRRYIRTGTTSTSLWRAAQESKSLPAPPAAAAMPRESVSASTHKLFGTGGKLFMTDAPDGSGGGIRTLVQLDGAMVTRITKDSLLDPDRLREHQEKIQAWFTETNQRWMRARAWLNWGATTATGAVIAYDVTMPAHWQHLAATLGLALVPSVLRRGIAIAMRRFLLHATKGPKALLPSRASAPRVAGSGALTT
jgi:hypothetical protein